jgi:hypothetical protein
LRSKRFSIQVDEAADCYGIGHLTAYVRYVEGATVNEDRFFCKFIKTRASTKELFRIADDFVEEKNIKWSECGGVCTDVARAMAGNKGLQALATKAMWTLCRTS